MIDVCKIQLICYSMEKQFEPMFIKMGLTFPVPRRKTFDNYDEMCILSIFKLKNMASAAST